MPESEWWDMVIWTKPQHSRQAVKRASKWLVQPEDQGQYWEALAIVNNWRSAHSYPLQAVMMLLRGNALRIDPSGDVVRRLKRLHSIQKKLERTNLDLLQMQDLGGCRAVVGDIDQVDAIVKRLEKSRTQCLQYDDDNYIAEPKDSGYRSYHLMYRYYGARIEYNGLRVEMQIRTLPQHWWATAVETVGLFTTQDLKGSLGNERWLRFFALMGSAVAYREGCAIVPGTPDDRQARCRELRDLASELDALKRFETYGFALRQVTEAFEGTAAPSIYLLVLDVPNGRLRITAFPRGFQEEAQEFYERAEAENADREGVDAVLVSADSIDALKRAYPNYFADTVAFGEMVAEEIK